MMEWKTGELKQEHLDEVYGLLSAPMPEEAIQRASTKQVKGYDTTGYGYQFIVNRLNEVLTPGHWRITESVDAEQSGKSWEAHAHLMLQLGNWKDGQFVAVAEMPAYGSSKNALQGDALKGGLTNALKKAAGMFGVGRAAFEGVIDEDLESPDTGGAGKGKGAGKSNKQGETAKAGGNGNGKNAEDYTLEELQEKYFILLERFGIDHDLADAYCRKVLKKGVSELNKKEIIGFATNLRKKAEEDMQKLKDELERAYEAEKSAA